MLLLSSAAINRVNTIHIRDNINRMLYILPNFSNPDDWRRLRQLSVLNVRYLTGCSGLSAPMERRAAQKAITSNHGGGWLLT